MLIYWLILRQYICLPSRHVGPRECQCTLKVHTMRIFSGVSAQPLCLYIGFYYDNIYACWADMSKANRLPMRPIDSQCTINKRIFSMVTASPLCWYIGLYYVNIYACRAREKHIYWHFNSFLWGFGAPAADMFVCIYLGTLCIYIS